MLLGTVRESLQPPIVGTFLTLTILGLWVSRRIARRTAASRPALIAMTTSLAAVLALTAVPQMGLVGIGHFTRLRIELFLAQLTDGNVWAHTWLLGLEGNLNIVLFVVPAFFATLAFRRYLPVVVSLSALSFALELWQAVTGGRAASINDWTFNTIGACVGVALATLGQLIAKGISPTAPADSG